MATRMLTQMGALMIHTKLESMERVLMTHRIDYLKNSFVREISDMTYDLTMYFDGTIGVEVKTGLMKKIHHERGSDNG